MRSARQGIRPLDGAQGRLKARFGVGVPGIGRKQTGFGVRDSGFGNREETDGVRDSGFAVRGERAKIQKAKN